MGSHGRVYRARHQALAVRAVAHARAGADRKPQPMADARAIRHPGVGAAAVQISRLVAAGTWQHHQRACHRTLRQADGVGRHLVPVCAVQAKAAAVALGQLALPQMPALAAPRARDFASLHALYTPLHRPAETEGRAREIAHQAAHAGACEKVTGDKWPVTGYSRATCHPLPPVTPMQTVHVNITDFEGKTHTLDGLEGWRLMEVIRDYGLPIKAECGGACACATCHVYVAPEWFDKLPPANSEETMMMDDAMAVEANSRLSCQIILTPEMEGLSVTLAPNP